MRKEQPMKSLFGYDFKHEIPLLQPAVSKWPELNVHKCSYHRCDDTLFATVAIGISELKSESVQKRLWKLCTLCLLPAESSQVGYLAIKNLTNGWGKVLLCKLNGGFKTFLKNKKVHVELKK